MGWRAIASTTLCATLGDVSMERISSYSERISLLTHKWYSPAKNLESQRRCTCDKKSYDFKVTDKTCCIHAEQRAMFDALRHHPDEIIDSELFFIRLDSEWNMSKSWDPYCTICSKMALDLWVKYFYLRHEKGITCYDTQEYNTLSYQ